MSCWQTACAAVAAWQLCACGKVIGIEELGAPPVVRVVPTTVYDELEDAIVFDELSVPVHTPGERQVELGVPGYGSIVCPAVHKFTHRLDHPDDNPIRWEFEVVDPRGIAIDPDAGMYRLRLQQLGADEADGDDEAWLTDWLPARLLETGAGSARYEVVLLRSQIPALATVYDNIEIELRGANELGVESEPVRFCWKHIPMAPPLQVRNVVESTGAGSLHETNLAPGNNLAPLLAGVPLEQGRAVMELEIVNGTDQVAYAKLAIEQTQATFTTSWQESNAFLFATKEASDCLATGECTFDTPPSCNTEAGTDESGTIDGLVSGIVVRDLLTGEQILPCDGCDSDTYAIEPRIQLGDPRIYRVQLMVTDLRALVPQLPDADLDAFTEVSLDAEFLPTVITGLVLERWRWCINGIPPDCFFDETYQHYLALTEASVSLPGVYLSARTSASPELPAAMPRARPGVLGAPVGLDTYSWSTVEEPLPPLFPEL